MVTDRQVGREIQSWMGHQNLGQSFTSKQLFIFLPAIQKQLKKIKQSLPRRNLVQELTQ
jgi:hypothetical protein